MGVLLAQTCPAVSAFPDSTIGSACTSSFSRFAQRSLALRPAHSRSHQIRDRYPGASDISSPPCLPRLLPAGAIAGWALHPLEKRRLVTAHVGTGPSPIRVGGDRGALTLRTWLDCQWGIERRVFVAARGVQLVLGQIYGAAQ